MWMECWRLCGREPFAHPAYVELSAAEGAEAVLLTVVDELGTVIMPLLVRNIGAEPWAHDVEARDATSPYGYGGPYSSHRRPYDAFWRLASDWMLREGIVSLIGRLALETPLCDRMPDAMRDRPVADNVVVDLGRSAEEQWRHYAHKVRKNVNKARRFGLTASVASDFSDVAEFVSLYRSTMDRRHAESRYYFDEEFFTTIAERLHGSFLVAEVRDPSARLVSAELVLTSDRFAYSFLGGTASEAFAHAPNDLLKHEVIDYARAAGLAAYVLGGGYQAGDGIFKYKLGFDPTGVVPFRRLEAMQPQGQDLVPVRTAWERSRCPIAALDPTFFPPYRAPLSGPAGSTRQDSTHDLN